MTVLGALEAIRPQDESGSNQVELAQPGAALVPYLATAGARPQSAQSHTSLNEMILSDAKRSHERAVRRVELMRTSTTLAALAQTEAALGERDSAVASAREALDRCITTSSDGGALIDASSASIAAEVLLRFDDAKYAYTVLSRAADVPECLRLTYAQIAAALGLYAEAEEALSVQDSSTTASLRGYLRARTGDFASAVHYLRQAVNEEPDDTGALLNLAISLWHLDSHRKATRMALRATRSAPQRKDASLLYLQMLLAEKEVALLTREIASLRDLRVVADAEFLEIQARTLILRGEIARAIPLLSNAADEARREGDELTEGRTRANLVRFKYRLGKLSRDRASQQLEKLLAKYPENDAVAVNFAEIAQTRRDASPLRAALPHLENTATPIRLAYLRHQVALLEGNNDAAASAADDWFSLEPNNAMAATAALISIGIGQARWDEAAVVADYAIEHFPNDRIVVNNAAYVLAMSGRSHEAIRLLEPIAKESYVLSATLGLAYLAHGDFQLGMRIYREAAEVAEKVFPPARGLMTAYQALVVRQLGLDKSLEPTMVEALALVPVALPDNWQDHPDYLRLHSICEKKGYPWPLNL